MRAGLFVVWHSLNNHCLIISGCARASLVLCGRYICHPSLFLRSRETIQMRRVWFATECIRTARWDVLSGICLSVLSDAVYVCVCVHKVSRGWQVARCTDKISFVQRSNAGRVVPLLAAWGHLLTRALLLMLLCLSVSVSVLYSGSEVIGSHVAVCLCVGSVSYLKCFIVPVCLLLSRQTAAVHWELWIHLGRSQGF